MTTDSTPMEIYLANIPFDDTSETKFRPALILSQSRTKILVFKITSKYESKSQKIKDVYYPIQEWQTAGLLKMSFVDTHKRCSIDLAEIQKRYVVGKLSPNDIQGLFNFIRKNKQQILDFKS